MNKLAKRITEGTIQRQFSNKKYSDTYSSQYKIGLCLPESNYSECQVLIGELEREFSQLDILFLTSMFSADEDSQRSVIESIIGSGCDILIVWPINVAAIQDLILEVQHLGVYVIALNQQIPGDNQYSYCIKPDFKEIGRKQVSYISYKLNISGLTESITMEVLHHPDEIFPCNEIYAGAKEMIQEYIESGVLVDEPKPIILYNEEDLVSIINSIISSGGYSSDNRLNVIYSCCESIANVVADALLSMEFQREDMPIITCFGDSSETIEKINDGLLSMTVVVNQEECAKAIIDMVCKLCSGETVECDEVIENEYGVAYVKYISGHVVTNDIDYVEYDEDGIYIAEDYPDGGLIYYNTTKPEPVRRLIGIDVIDLPYKTHYKKGDAFVSDGMKVLAYYSDGSSSEIKYFSCSPKELNTVGESIPIQVSYTQGDITEHCTMYVSVEEAVFDKSKINQTELKYNSTAGLASVNLFNHRLMFEHMDGTLGVNDYQIDVTHIYNSLFNETENLVVGNVPIKTGMGKGFKLNVQQYLLKKDSQYIYIDSAGLRHYFISLESSGYYDNSGLGLILQNEDVYDVITDNCGSKLYFDRDGRLIKNESCYNRKSKYYVYNEIGQLIKIYDERTPECFVSLRYSSEGLLESMAYILNDDIKCSVKYYYENGMLVRIVSDENSAAFAYDKYGQMILAVSLLDKSAIKIDYDSNGVRAISECITACLDDPATYVLNNINIPSDDILKSNAYFYMTNKSVTVRAKNGTAFNDEEDLTIVYYFNDNGFTTAVLEPNDGNSTDLRSTKKLPGTSLYIDGFNEGEEFIDTQPAYIIPAGEDVEFKLVDDAIDYRKKKYTNYKHYVVSFWLKIKSVVSDVKLGLVVKSGINSNSYTNESHVYIDSGAYNVWQYVTLPVEIPGEEIYSITLSGLPLCEIADIRLTYSPVSKYMISNGEKWLLMDDVESLTYVKANNQEKVKSVYSSSCYMSGKDLLDTFTNIYKATRSNSISTTGFILSLCDGTRKIYVKSVSLEVGGENIPFVIERVTGSGSDPIHYNAPYMLETISPDGKSVVRNYLSIYPNHTELYIKEALKQTSVAELDTDEIITTTTEKYVSFTGLTLMEVDEYGVTAKYTYDGNGNIASKTIGHGGTSEKISYEATLMRDKTIVTTPKSYNAINYDEVTGLATTAVNAGNVTDKYSSNFFEYDSANRLSCIRSAYQSDDMLFIAASKRKIGYDACGRINTVGLDVSLNHADTNIPRYVINYDKFNNIGSISYNSGGNNVNLLVKKISDYNAGISESIHYYEANKSYSTKITTNKYGITDSVLETDVNNVRSIGFVRQELWESRGAAEITNLYDPYEQIDYNFTYDEFNRPTGYTTSKYYYQGNTKDGFYVKQDGPAKVTYGGMDSLFWKITGETVFDSEKIMDPRIAETAFTVSAMANLTESCERTKYKYDQLGRVSKETKTLDGSNLRFGKVSIDTQKSYLKGTGLSNRTNVVVNDNELCDYVYEYDVRGRVVTATRHWYSSEQPSTQVTKYKYDGFDRIVSEERDGAITDYYYEENGDVVAEIPITRNAYGNCTQYNGIKVKWERGTLMSQFGDNSYRYNYQGQRYSKTVGEKTITYCYDGDKLIGETGYVYHYDANGISGIETYAFGTHEVYMYIKDGLGNVVALVSGNGEVARYEYDAWGKCTVYGSNGEININPNFIGNVNPIRWKSQYYDAESGLYYIGGRYYSPELRGYLCGESPEKILEQIGQPYCINAYRLTVTNPIDIAFEGHNITANAELSYDPEELSGWDFFWKVQFVKFWGSPLGALVAVELLVAAICVVVAFSAIPGVKSIAISIFVTSAMSFVAGAVITGFQCMKNGGNFWEGAAEYITENWARELAIASLTVIISVGAYAGAYMNAGRGAGLSNANCFKEGTLVETEEGLKPIEEIKVGDKVLAYDETTGEQAYKPVVQLFRNTTKEWYHIHVNGEEIVCTGGHPFYVLNATAARKIVNYEGQPQNAKGAWICANELKVSDKVLLSDGSCAIIESVEVEKLSEPETTYNFEVSDAHTYYVSDSKVLVHNICVEKPKMANRGSTGRTEPNNLVERLAMEQVKSDPLSGAKAIKSLSLNDKRWLSADGWIKMQSVVRSGSHQTTIHFVYNQSLNLVDDFKFVAFKAIL